MTRAFLLVKSVALCSSRKIFHTWYRTVLEIEVENLHCLKVASAKFEMFLVPCGSARLSKPHLRMTPLKG